MRSVRSAVRALAAAGARHVAAARRAAAARPARPAARQPGAARGRLAADAASGQSHLHIEATTRTRLHILNEFILKDYFWKYMCVVTRVSDSECSIFVRTAVPSDVARAARPQERLGGGADALCGRQPQRGGGRAGAQRRRHRRLAAAHRAAHAPRARAARPSAQKDEGNARRNIVLLLNAFRI